VLRSSAGFGRRAYIDERLAGRLPLGIDQQIRRVTGAAYRIVRVRLLSAS